MDQKSNDEPSLKGIAPPFGMLIVRGAPHPGYKVVEGLGMGGKHLDTIALSKAKDSDEVAIGFVRSQTLIAGRHVARHFLEGRPRFAQKVMKLFGPLEVVAAFATPKAFGFARYYESARVRHRLFSPGQHDIDEGEHLESEILAPDTLRYDRHGDVISEVHPYGVKSSAAILVKRLAQAGVHALQQVEMDVYEGPPSFHSGQ